MQYKNYYNISEALAVTVNCYCYYQYTTLQDPCLEAGADFISVVFRNEVSATMCEESTNDC